MVTGDLPACRADRVSGRIFACNPFPVFAHGDNAGRARRVGHYQGSVATIVRPDLHYLRVTAGAAPKSLFAELRFETINHVRRRFTDDLGDQRRSRHRVRRQNKQRHYRKKA